MKRQVSKKTIEAKSRLQLTLVSSPNLHCHPPHHHLPYCSPELKAFVFSATLSIRLKSIADLKMGQIPLLSHKNTHTQSCAHAGQQRHGHTHLITWIFENGKSGFSKQSSLAFLLISTLFMHPLFHSCCLSLSPSPAEISSIAGCTLQREMQSANPILSQKNTDNKVPFCLQRDISLIYLHFLSELYRLLGLSYFWGGYCHPKAEHNKHYSPF